MKISPYPDCQLVGTLMATVTYFNMPDERPVALALLTQTQLDMLGSSLKKVFMIGDGNEQFADLLRAFDKLDPLANAEKRPIS